MKSRGVTIVLCLFLGWLGVHRFYLRHYGMGILYFFTGGLFVIGNIIDLINYLSMSDAKFDMLYNNVGIPQQQVHFVQTNVKNVAAEIEKLHELKEKGIITAIEFEQRKNALLQ